MYHQDMLGSTALVTDETGTPALPPAGAGSVAYTAFGKLLCGRGGEPPGAGDPEGCEVGSPGGTPPEDFPRYQYDGAWGYESGLLALGGVNQRLAAIRLLHVGWRWYQPDIGRFIQRDPLGVRAGRNVYAYCFNEPTATVDPQGLQATHPKFCPYCGTTFSHKPGCPYSKGPPGGGGSSGRSGRARRGSTGLGPVQFVHKLHSIAIYYGVGFFAATISEGICIFYGVPWWAGDKYDVGDIYKAWWRGGKRLIDEPWD